MRTRHERGLHISNLFSLLVYLYSLGGNEIKFNSDEEEELKITLTKALVEDVDTLDENLKELGKCMFEEGETGMLNYSLSKIHLVLKSRDVSVE